VASSLPPSPLDDELRPGFRAKTVVTRLRPEELPEVEAAAARDGKSLAEWLRELALKTARQRSAPQKNASSSWQNLLSDFAED